MAPLIAPRPRHDVAGSFEAVYRAHVRDVYGFALGMVGNAHDAEDVAQTTFLNAYRALERGERVRNLRAWLFAIAQNVCRQRFRTAARRPQQVELDPEVAGRAVDDDVPTAREIRTAMMQLSFNQRTALVLREIEGLAYHEIADAMGMSLSAVETLLFRARQALREQLEAAEHDVGCEAMQRLISLQLDGNLSRPDKGIVRAHLRSCAECARFARSQRSRKRVMPGLVAVPLPAGLASGFGAGGFGAGGVGGAGLLGSKVAAVAVSAALVGTGTLVRTGVIPIPGKAPDTTAEAATEADSQVGAAPSSVAALVEFRSAQARRAALRASDGRLATKTVVKRRADGPRTAARTRGQAVAAEPATAPSGGSGESSASAAGVAGAVDVGSAVGGVHVGDAVDAVAGAAGGVTSPPAQVPADPIGTATGAIAGAESNLPSLPASPVTTPSLPPVSLPSTGSLP